MCHKNIFVNKRDFLYVVLVFAQIKIILGKTLKTNVISPLLTLLTLSKYEHYTILEQILENFQSNWIFNEYSFNVKFFFFVKSYILLVKLHHAITIPDIEYY